MTCKDKTLATHQGHSHYIEPSIQDLWDKREYLLASVKQLRKEIFVLERAVHEIEEQIFNAQDQAMVKIGSQWR